MTPSIPKPLSGLTGGIWHLFLLTFVVNTLLLVQPVYMLQVYDRVLAAGSLETLAFISIMAAAALMLLGIVDAVRWMICGRLAARLEAQLGPAAFRASMRPARAAIGDVQPLRDLASVRGFISGRGVLSFLDVPFIPFFIGILFLIHPHLFWLTIGGAAILAATALLNQSATTRHSAAANEATLAVFQTAQAFVKSAESLKAMGMMGNAERAWGLREVAAQSAQDRVNNINAAYSAFSRSIRIGLQIVLLGYGGYLVVAGQMTAGMIFASSLISGRALQPIDQIIGGWKGITDARRAWQRLVAALRSNAAPERLTDLPVPVGRISLENVVIFAPDARAGTEALIKGISAEIRAGQFVMVLGASGAGKSTLARAIVGALDLRSGHIRLDGSDIRQWDADRLGRHIGYVSQDIEMLPGTIAQNIARFDPDADDALVIEAAQKTHVHALIQQLPKGYDTVIGPGGHQLSGGQRQRIGLARAFYGRPKLLVLDEPNASLDFEGDKALERALLAAKAENVTTILVSQRLPLADKADVLMILRDGRIEDFGSREEVSRRQAQRAKSVQAVPAPAPPQASGRMVQPFALQPPPKLGIAASRGQE